MMKFDHEQLIQSIVISGKIPLLTAMIVMMRKSEYIYKDLRLCDRI